MLFYQLFKKLTKGICGKTQCYIIFVTMRIFIAIFFFLLLSTQLIPVKEVGKNLWSQTMAEEEVTPQNLVHKLQPINRLWYHDFTTSTDQFDQKNQQFFIIVDEALIKCFHLEVLTQPPNYFSLA